MQNHADVTNGQMYSHSAVMITCNINWTHFKVLHDVTPIAQRKCFIRMKKSPSTEARLWQSREWQSSAVAWMWPYIALFYVLTTKDRVILCLHLEVWIGLHVFKPTLSADLSVQSSTFPSAPCMTEPERPLAGRQASNQLCLPHVACRTPYSDWRGGVRERQREM